ncbi:MAG: winged helix-turn-helix transcriptional regulator [Candidatus Rokubacteria bacterium]|nr:winged helix-turn-helix transcriptional regulator [Candidatus Rokubacteria bacterium]
MKDHGDLMAKLFRGFGDVSRLRVLACLRDGPQSVGALVARTRLTQPNVSMHLGCLADCGLVTRERRGRFVDYALADKRVVKLLDQAEELLLEIDHRIEACPRYEAPSGAKRRRSPRQPRRRRR